MFWLYLGAAVLLGGLTLAIAHHLLRGGTDVEAGGLTTLQKRAWIGIAAGVAAAMGLIAVFLVRGLELYDEHPATRLLVYSLIGCGVAIHSFVVPRTWRGEPRSWADERDLRVFERAPAVQGVAVLLALAIWTILLTEWFQSSGSIPIVFPSLIFLSTFFVHLVSVSFGILIGYRRSLREAWE